MAESRAGLEAARLHNAIASLIANCLFSPTSFVLSQELILGLAV